MFFYVFLVVVFLFSCFCFLVPFFDVFDSSSKKFSYVSMLETNKQTRQENQKNKKKKQIRKEKGKEKKEEKKEKKKTKTISKRESQEKKTMTEDVG